MSLIAELRGRTVGRAALNAPKAAEYLQKAAQDRLSRPFPRASRPGEYPALRSGRLRREVRAVPRVLRGGIVITLQSPTPYAGSLVGSGRLLFRPVIEENRDAVREILVPGAH